MTGKQSRSPVLQKTTHPIEKISLTSPIVIYVPTRASLAVETKAFLSLWLAYLNNKSNVCSRCLFCF